MFINSSTYSAGISLCRKYLPSLDFTIDVEIYLGFFTLGSFRGHISSLLSQFSHDQALNTLKLFCVSLDKGSHIDLFTVLILGNFIEVEKKC